MEINAMDPHKKIKRIGLFDSGVGGLTVLKELLKLPCADYIYVGDTAHVPYGQKTPEQILEYSENIINFLVTQDIDALIIACHTSSAVALPTLQKVFTQLPLMGTIQETMQLVAKQSCNGRIGIIATQATINSHAHKKELLRLNNTLQVFEQACPRLVPLIEAPVLDTAELNAALHEYLQPLIAHNIDTLVIGCTHYSLITQQITAIVGNGVTLASCEKVIAQVLAPHLVGTVAEPKKVTVYVTGNDREQFANKASIILGQPVTVQQLAFNT